MRSSLFRDMRFCFFGSALLATIVLLLVIGCQPQALEAPATHSPRTPSETPTARAEMEMLQPTAPFTVTQVDTDTVSITPPPRRSECYHLESRLYDLTVAENPVELARTTGLFYEDGATRVVIQLTASGADVAFLAGYGAEVETQTQSLVQARVPLEKLCSLADDLRVKFVRVPQDAVAP